MAAVVWLTSLLVLLMVLTVVGLPFAIWKYVEWQFIQQGILFRDSSIRDAFRRGTSRVRGRWWYTVRLAGVLWLISVVAGPVLGFALLFTTLPPMASNIVGSGAPLAGWPARRPSRHD